MDGGLASPSLGWPAAAWKAPLPRLVADALALVACLARVGLAGLLGAPAYGKRLHLSRADPPTVARAWKRARGEGDSGAGCGDGDG